MTKRIINTYDIAHEVLIFILDHASCGGEFNTEIAPVIILLECKKCNEELLVDRTLMERAARRAKD